MSHVAFLGTGLIGSAMVEAALGRGETVSVWNRTQDKAKPLAKLGATVAEDAAEAVRGAGRVHLALTDDAAVDAVIAAIRPGLGAGVVVVDHSTASPAGTAARFRRCEELGIELLHAPVFMAPQHCRQAQGLMLSAGPRARFDRVKEALERMTGEVWFVGERGDLAAAYKLFGNAMILTIVGGLSDVFAMASSLGIDAKEAHALFSKFNPAGTIGYRGSKMAQGDFAAAFALTMARKDLRLMLEAAGDRKLALLPALAKRMDAFIAAGRGDEDVGVLAAPAVESHRG
ncbi:MAG: NAD(P)-dependent oxidoreductase [Myxococcales bacterium]|nr:NAD(P)-dependent oxidoreductase [Myxococcales bacterium]MCB9579579.1 NAD(P)-dependent oxidoreductase [Polyangiaceae bacterium]